MTSYIPPHLRNRSTPATDMTFRRNLDVLRGNSSNSRRNYKNKKKTTPADKII